MFFSQKATNVSYYTGECVRSEQQEMKQVTPRE